MGKLLDNGFRGSRVLKIATIRDSEWFEEKEDWWKFCFNDAVEKELFHLRNKHWHLGGDTLFIPVRHPDAGIGGTTSIRIPGRFLDLEIENRDPFMPKMIEAASYLEDLPEFQKEKFWDLVEMLGYEPDSYLTNTPVAISPDGRSVLHITLRPADRSNDLLGVVAVSPTSRYDGGVTEDLPVMDKQDMLILAR